MPDEIEVLENHIAQVEEALTEAMQGLRRLKRIRDRLVHGHGQASIFDSIVEPKSQFLRVAEALIAKGNKPKTANWIVKAAGLTRSSLSQILHRTHRESFLSRAIPGYSRKKLWALTDEAAAAARHQLQGMLFDPSSDFAGMKAVDCCAKILEEQDNEPMNALTLAREAMRRGYRGKTRGPEDEVLLTTAKSFWAALSRDKRFQEIRPLVFALKDWPRVGKRQED